MKTDIREWKVIWHFFRPHKIKSLIVLLTMFLSGLFEMLNLAVLYPIINYGLDLEKKNFVLENFEKAIAHTIPDNPFLASCVLLIIVSVLAVVFKFIYKWCSNKLMIQIVKDNQKKILERFIAAEYNFYIKNQQGKLIYAGTTASERTGTAIFTVITLVYNVITALFLFFLLVLLSWQATIAILLVGLFYAFVIKTVMDKFIYKCTRISVEESQRRNVILNELITGIKTIKIFLAFDEWRKRHTAAVDRGLDVKFLMLTGRVFPEVFVKFVFYILIALTGIVLSQQSHHEVISLLPLFGTFAVVVNRFIPFAHLIGSGVMQIAEFMPDTKIAYDLCKEEFSVSFDGKKALEGFTDKISFENVKFKYTNMENVLLKNISFSVERRKMTALVGYSGSGKTT
ncbi:MAG: ABC transporter ATP-binding protein, partial [Candidatus Omnitrophica bacterium]|nr:ABC transporter ATP-binding protein [Candidatus Omnitrophota bacterium]